MSISGESQRSRAGAGSRRRRRRAATTAAVAGAGVERGPQLDAAGRREHLDGQHAGQAVDGRGAACGPPDQPIETWSSCIAELGIESTDAGAASRFISETIAAWVYCAIMWPLSTPGSSARNGGRPWLRATSRNRSVRRSEIEATSAATIARKSST